MSEYDVEQELLNEIGDLRNELKQYKNIEDELGIDLITLFKASQSETITIKGIDFDYEVDEYHFDLRNKYIVVQLLRNDNYETEVYYFKDYGKTWALTKEELENE